MSEPPDEVARTVETFIQRYYDLEIIISPEAHKLVTKAEKMFSDLLGNIIRDYIIEKHNATAEKREINAQIMADCFGLITKVYANGFVTQGTNLLEKLDDCRKRNSELMKDLAICMANYTALQREYERLLKMLDQNQSKESKNEEEENEQS